MSKLNKLCEDDINHEFEIDKFLLNEVYKNSLNSKDDELFDNSFLAAWDFLYEHPIFKGKFKKCLDVYPSKEQGKYSLETCVYEAHDESYGWNTDEFVQVYDSDLDVTDESFSKAIKKLSKLVKEKYGYYTDIESEISEYELMFGRDLAKIKYDEKHLIIKNKLKGIDY